MEFSGFRVETNGTPFCMVNQAVAPSDEKGQAKSCHKVTLVGHRSLSVSRCYYHSMAGVY